MRSTIGGQTNLLQTILVPIRVWHTPSAAHYISFHAETGNALLPHPSQGKMRHTSVALITLGSTEPRTSVLLFFSLSSCSQPRDLEPADHFKFSRSEQALDLPRSPSITCRASATRIVVSTSRPFLGPPREQPLASATAQSISEPSQSL